MAAPARIRRSLFDRLLDVPGNVPEGLLQTCTVEQMRTPWRVIWKACSTPGLR